MADAAPVSRQRRFVAVARWPYATVHFGQPTTLEKAIEEAEAERQDTRGGLTRRVAVYELVKVKS